MIFQRALHRELISTAGAVLTTLFTITITVMLIRILGQAAGGRVASEDVVALIGFATLNYLPIILILTSFISVLLVFTRSYQDSEMVVWFASGLSLSDWIKPVLLFGAPIIATTAILSFIVTPWANQQSAAFMERFEKRQDIARVSPGKFQESSSADRVFFVESVSGDATKVQNVFVNISRPDRTGVVIAKEGTIEQDPRGYKFLVMQQGRSYSGMPTQSDFQVMEFEKYRILVSSKPSVVTGAMSSRALPTLTLLKQNTPFNRGELLWRIALPLMGVCLILLAIPLSFINPRAGRSANLLLTLLLFVIYSNMVSVFQAAVVQNKIAFGLAWWPIHALALLMMTLLFLWRINMNSRRHPLRLFAKLRFTSASRCATRQKDAK